MTRISSTRNVLTWLGLLLTLTIPAWAALLAPATVQALIERVREVGPSTRIFG